jgi:polysaccharide pyruvyl transferase CsaB
MAKQILIAGYYGFNNAGDEAILSAMIHDLREQLPDLKIVVLSGNPRATVKLHGAEAISWIEIKTIINTMKMSDLVLLGGGGLFHDYWGFDPNTILTQNHSGIAFFSGFSFMATLLMKPLMMYAVGIGPLFSDLGRQYTRFAFEQAHIITVRDDQSKEQLIALGIAPDKITITADPALGVFSKVAKVHPRELPPDKGPLLCAALRNWDIGISPLHWENQVARALDIFIDRNDGTVLFLPFQELSKPELNDRNVSERIRDQMINKNRSFIMREDLSFSERAEVLSRCDIVLGMRLHALEFAVRSCVPMVGLAYDEKVRNLLARIKFDDRLLDMREITAKSLASLLTDTLNDRDELITRLKTEGKKLAASAKENARLAIGLLKNQQPGKTSLKPVASELPGSIVLSLAQLVFDEQTQISECNKVISEWQAALTNQVVEHDKMISNLKGVEKKLRTQLDERDKVIIEWQAALKIQVGERDKMISALQEKQKILNTQIDERDIVITEWQAALKTQVGERDKMISDLHEEQKNLISSYEEQIQGLRTRQESLASQLKVQGDALAEIHTSRYWKLLSVYWGIRNKTAVSVECLRNWLRKWIPFKFRRWVIRVLIANRSNILNPEIDSLELFSKELEDIHEIPSFSSQIPSQTTSYDIICLPIINWEFRYQRPQQLITQFAQHGHRCFYINQTFQQVQKTPIIQKLGENIFDIELPGPVGLNIYAEEITTKILQALFQAIDSLRRTANIIEAVCIVDLPFWMPLADKLKEKWGWKIIYDCMDDHAGFSTNSPRMLKHEKKLFEISDLVLAASQSLLLKCSRFSDRVLYLPNAADFEHFSRSITEDPIPDIKGPVIGYYGAISEWFDDKLIYNAAFKHPDWQFVLIGDIFGAELKLLQSLSNVHFLGEIPYGKLPAYLHRFNVACIPFKLTPLTLSTNPVKFYEYLSAGKPVVAVDLPELEQYSGYYYPFHSLDEFENQVEKALKESSPVLAQVAIQLTKQNTWQDRYHLLGEAIQKLYGKAIIIILSYDNLDYLKLCLDAIWKKTGYPNYEVIVVDNGSKSDVIDYLKTMEHQEPKLRAILNNENFGFARANNIGIEAAGECEFIVLLNDDTIVTRGWLTRLIRNLSDSNIKLAGPVTNWAGNEARINVDYDNLDALENFSRVYCDSHEGKFFDIPMLAMYCVIMRRSLLDEIGLLDERFGIGLFEDDDFSMRVRRSGGRIVCVEDVFVHHWGKAALRRMSQEEYDQLFDENLKKFEEKWQIKWQAHQDRT